MLRVLSESAGDQRILAMADSYYGGKPLLGDLPETMSVIVRLKRDSQLYEITDPYGEPTMGRPRKKGAKLTQPMNWLEQSEGWDVLSVQRYDETRRVNCRRKKPCGFTGPGRILSGS